MNRLKQITNFVSQLRVRTFLPLLVAFGLFALPAVAGAQLDTNPGNFGGLNNTVFSSPTSAIRTIVNYILALVLIIDVAFIIIGGFLIIISAGNPDRNKQGKAMVLNAIIGLVIIIFAYTISLSVASIARNFN